jgi:hypothetical protein
MVENGKLGKPTELYYVYRDPGEVDTPLGQKMVGIQS